MGCKELVALAMMLAVTPAFATSRQAPVTTGAPEASADARYCLRVEAVTGSIVETIRCETREGWALLDVDVDAEWAEEGVRVIASNQ
jgi:hypothetical protein